MLAELIMIVCLKPDRPLSCSLRVLLFAARDFVVIPLFVSKYMQADL